MLTAQRFFQLERTGQVQHIQRKSLKFQVGKENSEKLGMEKSNKLTEGLGSQGKRWISSFLTPLRILFLETAEELNEIIWSIFHKLVKILNLQHTYVSVVTGEQRL